MKPNTLKISCLVPFFLLSVFIGRASNIDSLSTQLNSENSERNFEILFKIVKLTGRNNLDTALFYADRALEIADFLKNKEMKAKTFQMKAQCYLFNNQREKAIVFFNKEFEVWDKLGNIKEKAEAMINMGVTYNQMSELDSALYCYNEVLEFYKASNDIKGQSNAIRKIGYIQGQLENYTLALENYFIALKMAESNNLLEDEANTCNSIGIIYGKTLDYDLSLDYFKRATKIFESLNNTRSLGSLYTNIGNIYAYSKEKYDTALIYYQKSLQIDRSVKKMSSVSVDLVAISFTYTKLGDNEKALEFAVQAMAIDKKYGFDLNLISSYLRLGEIYKDRGNYLLAQENYNMGLELAIRLKVKRKISVAYDSMHKLAIEMNDYESALTNYKLYKAYNDSLLNEDTKKEIAEMQIKYETEKTKLENQTLKLQTEKDKNAKTQLFILSALLVTILSFLAYFLIVKSRTIKRNLEFYEKDRLLNEALKKSAEAEKKRFTELIFAEKKINDLQREKIVAKNRELSTLVINIHNKNQIFNKLAEKIEKVEKSNNFSLQSLSGLKDLISGKKIVDEDWNVLKNQIEKVYPGFFDRLAKQCPAFTENDHKLCSYFLIEMSTKEIANLMYVSDAAIIKSRQRLRKKVGIDNNEDFLTFLLNI